MEYSSILLDNNLTNGLGNIKLSQPNGTFKLTPSSYILIKAIADNKHLLTGIGIDWGSGIGCMAILAAKINKVNKIYGLEISKKNLEISKKNALENNVEDKIIFTLSDSYVPLEKEDKRFNQNTHDINFILANPPSSVGDDGFGYRREVLKSSKKFLADNSVIFLNISYQYGKKRIEHLYNNDLNFEYNGVIATTDWVPFNLKNQHLLNCLNTYIKEESNGGFKYTFFIEDNNGLYLTAQETLKYFNKTGKSPLTKWQTHMFKFIKR